LGGVVRLATLKGKTAKLGKVEPVCLNRMKAKISFEFAMREEDFDAVS
jgi:hypothetical protein